MAYVILNGSNALKELKKVKNVIKFVRQELESKVKSSTPQITKLWVIDDNIIAWVKDVENKQIDDISTQQFKDANFLKMWLNPGTVTRAAMADVYEKICKKFCKNILYFIPSKLCDIISKMASKYSPKAKVLMDNFNRKAVDLRIRVKNLSIRKPFVGADFKEFNKIKKSSKHLQMEKYLMVHMVI